MMMMSIYVTRNENEEDEKGTKKRRKEKTRNKIHHLITCVSRWML
jgi:hypothetical protein